MAELYYQGHGSYRITTQNNTVIYVDPYAGDGYDIPGDVIIVTHEHGDHNHTDLVTRKEGGVILRHADLFDGQTYLTHTFKDITVTGTPAENKNHPRSQCVGFILTCDGKKIYGAGDTSYFPEMEAFEHLDLALLPCDGIYNMGPVEAAHCADVMDVKKAIPVHMAPGRLYDKAQAQRFRSDKALFVEPGETLDI